MEGADGLQETLRSKTVIRSSNWMAAESYNGNKNVHHKELFEYLLEMVEASKRGNGDVSGTEQLHSMSLTDLHKAVICNCYDEVQRLLKEPESLSTINYETVVGETALYFASYIGSLPLVLLLLENGAAVTTADTADESELLGAVRTDQTMITEILLSKGSNVNAVCEYWAPIHVACFRKTPSIIRLLVKNGANVNLIGDWSYAPINLLFIDFSVKQRYLLQSNDEWKIKRCLDELLTSPNLDTNYWSKCALGNPVVVSRALTMLSPTIFRMLINNGACTEVLLDHSKRAIHDELVLYSIRSTKIGFGLTDRVERYNDCVHLLVNHGVEPTEWACHVRIARLLLRQLSAVSLTKRQPEMEPVFRTLIQYCTRPLSLKDLCRRVVRRVVGHPLAHNLQSMVLPTRVKSYILMSEIGGNELYTF